MRVKLDRLKELVGRRTQWQGQLTSLKRMREWVWTAESLLSGAWAEAEEILTNAAVAERFDQWWHHLAQSQGSDHYSEQERQWLEHFVQTTQNLRPHLICCYDVEGLPRTNNDTERYIRSLKTHYRRISGRKNWSSYLLRYGRYVAYYDCLEHQAGGEATIERRLKQVSHQQWRVARNTAHAGCCEQLKMWRFRHKRDLYLQALERRWEATIEGT